MRLAPAFFVTLLGIGMGLAAAAEPDWRVEVHSRFVRSAAPVPATAAAPLSVALTFDACGGGFDADLVQTLVRLRVPATIFVTRKWLARNPAGAAALLAHPELFEIENHGAAHLPAVLGSERKVYGLAGARDVAQLEDEISGGGRAIAALTGRAPHYFRGATAVYDEAGIAAARRLGYEIAGFSLNADLGATLPREVIVERLRRVRDGDVVIAHMNRPQGATARALAAALPELQARGVEFVTLAAGRLERVR